jgi:ABC-type sugar transport system permease subunit
MKHSLMPTCLRVERRAETLTGWALVLPALIGFMVFYALPTLRAVEISLTDWNMLRAPRFVGLDNYAAMLEDGKFWNGMKLSAYYVLLNIPAQTVLGLFLAVAMDRLTRGSGNVIRQAEMLRELGARTQKRLALDHDAGALPPPDSDLGEAAE